MAKGGDVFILDMGEPVKIVNLAKNLIQLSGLSVKDENNPKGDIEITYTGLRPGEKAWFSPAEFAALPDTPVGRFARAATAGPMQKNMARGAGGLCLHDVCPVLYLTHPELFTGRQAGVHVETRGTVTYAKTVTDLDSDAKFPERNVFVVLGVDRAGFAAHITEALSSYAG